MSTMDSASFYKQCLDEDRSFKVGDLVEAFWTCCSRQYKAKARIVRLNEKSIRVSLEEDVPGTDTIFTGYRKGHPINVPRLIAFDRWSIGNCARAIPTDGLASTPIPS